MQLASIVLILHYISHSNCCLLLFHQGFIPSMSSYAIVQAVAIIGSVVMPHNIFLHSALVQTKPIDRTNQIKVSEASFYYSVEAAIALFVSFLTNLAVLTVFATGFYSAACASQGLAEVGGVCTTIGLQQAGATLHELLGDKARVVWAVGLLAAGQSSTMTSTYASQYACEGFLNLTVS